MFAVFAVLILLIIVLIFYICVRSFRKLSIFKNIKNKVLVWCISLIPMIILFSVFNTMNSIVIILHYVIFIGITYLIMSIFKKKNNDILVIISVILTVIYMGYGYYMAHHIDETRYVVNASKKINNDFRIIQISDTHIGAIFSGLEFRDYIEKISKIEADIVVITGDFIDDDTSYEDMVNACASFSLLHPKYGIYYVNGNHDRGYYSRKYSYNDLVFELNKNNVKVLTDEVVDINDNIVLVGREDKQIASRKDISSLVSNIDKSKYIIDLNHQPNDYDNETDVVDLVLSGHTHGGQMFPLKYIGQFIGANDETYGLHQRGNTTFIVSSGMGCWALDFKTATKSEYVVIDIKGENNE